MDKFLLTQIKADAKDGKPVLRATILFSLFDTIGPLAEWMHEHSRLKQARYSLNCEVHGWADRPCGEVHVSVTASRKWEVIPFDILEGEGPVHWFDPWPDALALKDQLGMTGLTIHDRSGAMELDIMDRDLAMLFRLRWQDHFLMVQHVGPGEDFNDMGFDSEG